MKPISENKLHLSDEIIKTVSIYYGVKKRQIKGRSRSYNDGTIPARLMISLLLRNSGLKYEQIGFLLNRRHHTIIHEVRQQIGYVSVYKEVGSDYEHFLKLFKINVQSDIQF
jgi:chromosomal replication initiation ATPase DnaA